MSVLPKDVSDSDSSNRLSPEERLKLAIFDRIPFTIWASTRDFKIVLWNRTSEEKYGHTQKDAIGKDYVELFVDDLEKEASRVDCLAIIDKDEQFKNFLAYDHAANGARRTMLTNCFRVYDEYRQDYLQVEVGVSADELNIDAERDRLHSLRDLAKRTREERARAAEAEARAADALRDSLIATVTERLNHKILRLEVRRDKVQDLRSDAPSNSREAHDFAVELKKIETEVKDTRKMNLELIRRVRCATNIDILIEIQEELDAST